MFFNTHSSEALSSAREKTLTFISDVANFLSAVIDHFIHKEALTSDDAFALETIKQNHASLINLKAYAQSEKRTASELKALITLTKKELLLFVGDVPLIEDDGTIFDDSKDLRELLKDSVLLADLSQLQARAQALPAAFPSDNEMSFLSFSELLMKSDMEAEESTFPCGSHTFG